MTLRTEVEAGASGYSVTGGGDQGIFVKQVLKDSSAAKLFSLREGAWPPRPWGPHRSRPWGPPSSHQDRRARGSGRPRQDRPLPGRAGLSRCAAGWPPSHAGLRAGWAGLPVSRPSHTPLYLWKAWREQGTEAEGPLCLSRRSAAQCNRILRQHQIRRRSQNPPVLRAVQGSVPSQAETTRRRG